MARLNSVGGTNCAKSWSMSAPMAFWISFASRVSALIVRSCSTGSSICTGRRTNIVDTWFVPSCSERPCTDTGTEHTSGVSGRSSWAIRYWRKRLRAGGEHDVVHRRAERRLDVAHVVERRLAERDGPVRRDRAGPSHLRRGERQRGRRAIFARSRRAAVARCRRRSATVLPKTLAIVRGRRTMCCIAYATSSRSDGTGSGCHGSSGGSGSGASGVRSNRFASRSAPVTPSMVEWWILVTKPTLPSSRPSRRCSSHSGRLRSRGTARDVGHRLRPARASCPAPGPRRGGCAPRGRSRGPRSTPGGRGRTGPARAGAGTAASRCRRVRRMWTHALEREARRPRSGRGRARPRRGPAGTASPCRGRTRPSRSVASCAQSDAARRPRRGC